VITGSLTTIHLFAEEAGVPGSAVNARYTLQYQAIQAHLATGTNRAHRG
jgi:hypothetical protein